MAVSITFLGHAGFVFDDGTHAIAIDPFLTGNPVAKHEPADIHCQYIAITHGHPDHLGDTVAIAKTNNATVIATFEITQFVGEQGITQVEPSNIGGKIKTDFGWVALTAAFHSSSCNGRYMGMPCGLVVHMGGTTIYHCGDTGLFSDMKLIGEIYRPDIACIPIGDRFTMDAEMATRAAEMINPKVAIPMHYATWDLLAPNTSAFKPTDIEVKILKPSQNWQYS